jgi:hypothetical protein
MYKKLFSLFLLLFLFSQAALPNIKLFPGYFIDLKGDSVQCQIEFNDWNNNPKTIQVVVNNERREFGPEEIKGFGVLGYSDYMSGKVSYHVKPFSIKDLSEKYSDSIETKTCFLKVLERGYYSLYGLIYTEGVYFFMDYTGSPVSEMVNRSRLKSDSLEEDQQFKKEIFTLFVKEGIVDKYFNRIDNAQYNASDLSSLFRILNEAHSGVKIKKKSTGNIQIEVFAGVVRNIFPTVFTVDYIYPAQFDPCNSFSGGLNFLYSIPGNFKSFKVGLSLGYNSFNKSINQSGSSTDTVSANYYYTKSYTQTITIKNSTLVGNFYVMYVINPLSRTNIFVKGGLQVNLLLSKPMDVHQNNTYTTDGIQNGNVPFHEYTASDISALTLNESLVSFIAAAGIINGRNKLEFSYSPPSNLVTPSGDPTAPYTGPFKYGTIAIFYYFSLFPENRGKL